MSSLESNVEVRTVVKDSIVYRDREVLPVGSFDFKDGWAEVKGVIKDKDIQLELQVKDTIRQIIHRVPRRFLFFRWGTKAVYQEVVVSSPYTNITYTEYLEFVK